MKYKEKYKTGMIFRTKEYPHKDIEIGYVSYARDSESAYMFNMLSIIDWSIANREAFNKYVCEKKGTDYSTTFPYPSWGEMRTKSIDAYIRKYKLEFVGMSDKKVDIYADNEYEYSSGFREFY